MTPHVIWYMGGKSHIRDWILSVFPEHDCYVEVFGGGASVLFAKKPSKFEVYNDKWDEVVNFFKVLKEKPKEMQEFLSSIPVSRTIANEFLEKWKRKEYANELERACIFLYLNKLSMNAEMEFIVADPLRPRAKYLTSTVEQIQSFSKRLRNVFIENLDFVEVIKRYDKPSTLFYCDPPYLDKTYYTERFSFTQHHRLAKLLNSISGFAVVSYYYDKELEELYPKDKWTWLKKEVLKHATFVPDVHSRPKAIEHLFLNYDPKKVKKVNISGKTLIEVFS